MTAGVAAGHPATAEVGLRTLTQGGGAADAAVAAMLAACVAETILVGLGGGGFATYYEAATGTVTCLDFFCTVPGLDRDGEPAAMEPIEVAFGDVSMRYLIGGASVAVPGVPAGAGEVHRRWGRLPWPDVVAPAVSLATAGVLLPSAQADTLVEVAPALLPGDGARGYAPAGRLLRGGDLLLHPGLADSLAELAAHGPACFYTGHLGKLTVQTVRAAGGCLGPADLAAYKVTRVPVARARLAQHEVYARTDFSATIATIDRLPATLADLPRPDRAVALARALLADPHDQRGGTSNISVVDGDGNACVITLTMGLGSGVWLPGHGVHLNSMLGELELVTAELAPGQRMASNMVPLVVIDPGGALALAAGSAGASRIRTALITTLVGVLLDGRDTTSAIAAPRIHPVRGELPDAPPVAQVEPGCPADDVAALVADGFVVNQWKQRSHYFGGVSAVGRTDAAGDPRRGGIGRLLPRS